MVGLWRSVRPSEWPAGWNDACRGRRHGGCAESGDDGQHGRSSRPTHEHFRGTAEWGRWDDGEADGRVLNVRPAFIRKQCWKVMGGTCAREVDGWGCTR